VELIIFGFVGLGLLIIGVMIALGALALLPVTLALAVIGWLIGGSTGALVGVAISGVIGLVMLNND